MAFASSSTSATMQWWFLLVLETGATIELVVARWKKCFFQAVLVIWPTWVQISTPPAAAQELQLWNSYELPWSEMVVNRDGAEHENETVKFVGRHQHSLAIQLRVMWGKLWFFWLLIWQFYGRWHLLPVSTPATIALMALLGLEATLFLPIARVPLLRL